MTMSRELFQENRDKKIYGKDTTLIIDWVRHAQKLSGEVFNENQIDLAKSNISPRGVADAEALGQSLPKSKNRVKGFVSQRQPRTRETINSIFAGYKAAHPEVEFYDNIGERESLYPDAQLANPDFLNIYYSKLTINKKALLEAEGRTLEDFSKLSSDAQMRIAEAAEELVVREWLDNPNSEMARLVPLRRVAAEFAQLFISQNRVARFMKPGDERRFVNVTHKTVTEPFLISGILMSRPEGKRITTLKQLGGSLEPLGNWTSQIHLDNEGKPNITIRLRGQEFDVDMDVLQELHSEGKSTKPHH